MECCSDDRYSPLIDSHGQSRRNRVLRPVRIRCGVQTVLDLPLPSPPRLTHHSQKLLLALGSWLMLLDPLGNHALNSMEVPDRPGRHTRRTLALRVSKPRHQDVEVIALVQADLHLALGFC